MAPLTLIQSIMDTAQALENCRRTDNTEWIGRHIATLKQLYSLLPSGSGIDNGTRVVDVQPLRLTLSCGFHHMNENGYYDGWTQHTIVVTPNWHSIDVRVTGPNRNDVKDSLAEVYSITLTTKVDYIDGCYRFVGR